MDIYSSKVLELSTNISHIHKDIDHNVVGFAHSHKISKLCGSEIELSIIIDKENDKIIDFSINPKACALGQASASILSHDIIGATGDEIIKARDELKFMLKHDGPFPMGRFWELRYLEAVKDYPPRHTSTLLAWEAAAEAVEKARQKAFSK